VGLEIVVGRTRPSPGMRPEDVMLPGPGLYEVEFGVPTWLPDFDNKSAHSFDVGRYHLQHVRSRKQAGTLVIRLRATRNPTAPTTRTAGVEIAILDDLTVLGVLQGLSFLFGAVLVGWILSSLVQAMREARKILEIGPVQIVGGVVVLAIFIPRLRHAFARGT
jgi:hypothetical protein